MPHIGLYNVYLEDENAEEYTCELTLPGIDGYFEGEGYSKSQARMDAAAKAYEYLDENDMLLTMECWQDVHPAQRFRCVHLRVPQQGKGCVHHTPPPSSGWWQAQKRPGHTSRSSGSVWRHRSVA